MLKIIDCHCTFKNGTIAHSMLSVNVFVCVVQIQVVQRSGRVIGSCELSVTNERVDVSRLDVSVVSGLSLSVSSKTDFPGALSVHVTKNNLMHQRYQVTDYIMCFNSALSS